ncbi:hypothetical protein QBC46DRAFT_369544, partial [Diplogelasinospora grovesii]
MSKSTCANMFQVPLFLAHPFLVLLFALLSRSLHFPTSLSFAFPPPPIVYELYLVSSLSAYATTHQPLRPVVLPSIISLPSALTIIDRGLVYPPPPPC